MKEEKLDVANLMSRKEFMTKMGAGSLLFITGVSGLLTSCGGGEEDPKPSGPTIYSADLSVAPFDVLKNDGGWVRHPEVAILLVNVGGEVRAFSGLCPHQGCSDKWSYSTEKFRCGCHGSTFRNDGSLVAGPATSGLASRSFTQEGDVITFD